MALIKGNIARKIHKQNTSRRGGIMEIQSQNQPLSKEEVKNPNIIKFIYSLQHIITVEQIIDFLNSFNIVYTDFNIIDVHDKNGKKININVNVYNKDVLVCQIISVYSINFELQSKIANIPPDEPVEYIIDLAIKLVDILKEYNANYFYIGGQSTMCMYANIYANNLNIVCIDSTTKRVSEDGPNGTKISVSKHVMWRIIFVWN